MARFVLFNSGEEDIEPVLAHVRGSEDAQLVDCTGARAVLVEASPDWVERARNLLPGWRIVAETSQSRPRPPFPRPAWDLKRTDRSDPAD